MSAAALCVIAGLAWWRSSAPRLDGPMSAARTYATQAAQRATIELPNGSRAILAPNTQLAVQTGARGDVVVTLRGQAFFTVAHAAERAFVVRTGAVETRVLGTAFDVRHYATDSLVEVAVVNGKVQTGTPVRSIVLTTGTVGRATDSTAAATSVRDISTYTSWTDGRLVFVDAPIPSMLTTIERWSGYRFRVADSTLRARLDAQHVTTDLMVGDPRGMLTMLQDILDVSLRVTGDTVTLSPRRRTPVLREGPRATPRTLSRPDGFSLSPEVGK